MLLSDIPALRADAEKHKAERLAVLNGLLRGIVEIESPQLPPKPIGLEALSGFLAALREIEIIDRMERDLLAHGKLTLTPETATTTPA